MVEHEQLQQQMKFLEHLMEAATNQIQAVADHFERGALMAYPNSFSDPDMQRKHEELTAKVDLIIDRMQEVHKKLTGQ